MPKWIYIHLTHGQRTIIDIEDYPRVKKDYKWYARKSSNGYYTEAKFKNKYGNIETKRLSHLILNFDSTLPESKGLVMDHKNRDPSDNRSRNLRIVTFQINALNRNPREDSKTGVVGIQEELNAYIVDWRENGEHKRKYFTFFKRDKMIIFWMAYDFYFNTISNIEEYREALCFDEPEQSNGSPDDYIDEDDYEYLINPRLKNRNEFLSESGHKNIRIQDRALRFYMTINGERIEEYFPFDKEYKGDLRDQTNKTWKEALTLYDEMFKKKTESKNKKIKKKETYENEFNSKIYFENNEMEIEYENEEKYNMMDLII